MPGREYTAQSVGGYRFGFNGKEKDDENKGKGNSIDYDFRIADTRLGRWLSIDRFEGKHPWTTPYGFLANNPIIFIDPDGNEIRLWAFTDLQSVAWQQLKNTIESRFNGLVVIDKVEKQTTPVWNGEFDKKGNPVMISKTYHQVTMTINEVQLRANAVAKLPINASTKDIDSKMEEMRTELKSGSTYKELENMITSPIVSNYQLTNHQFGAFAGGGNGQGINMKNISLFKDVKELGAFTILYHELEEGFSYYSAKKSGSSNLSYGFHHLKAITNKAKI